MERHFGVQTMDEALGPRMSLCGEMATLEDFKQVFTGRKLNSGVRVALLWDTLQGSLEIAILEAGQSIDLRNVRAEAHCPPVQNSKCLKPLAFMVSDSPGFISLVQGAVPGTIPSTSDDSADAWRGIDASEEAVGDDGNVVC
jgi:hypothetical protein